MALNTGPILIYEALNIELSLIWAEKGWAKKGGHHFEIRAWPYWILICYKTSFFFNKNTI